MSTETKIRPHDRAESFHSAINEQNVFVFFYQGPKTLGVQSDLKHHREVSRLWQRRQRSSGGVAGTVILGGLTNNVHRVEQSCSSLWCQQNYNNHWKPLTVSHTPTAEVYLTNGYMYEYFQLSAEKDGPWVWVTTLCYIYCPHWVVQWRWNKPIASMLPYSFTMFDNWLSLTYKDPIVLTMTESQLSWLHRTFFLASQGHWCLIRGEGTEKNHVTSSFLR